MKLFFIQRLTLSTMISGLVVLIIIAINSLAYNNTYYDRYLYRNHDYIAEESLAGNYYYLYE